VGLLSVLLEECEAVDSVTFGITTFNRPKQLNKLVVSIEHRYPKAIIRIADNGDRQERIEKSNVVREVLPFDSGASACRNWLMRTVETEFLVLLDDDFVFIPDTSIEAMVDVMDCCQMVGVVGGLVRERIAQADPTYDFEGMSIVPTKSAMRKTSKGIRYRICQYVRMFVLVRKEVAETTQWQEDLKIGGEHRSFFFDLKEAGIWGVAWTPDSAIRHEIYEGDSKYKEFRARGSKFEQIAFDRLRRRASG